MAPLDEQTAIAFIHCGMDVIHEGLYLIRSGARSLEHPDAMDYADAIERVGRALYKMRKYLHDEHGAAMYFSPWLNKRVEEEQTSAGCRPKTNDVTYSERD